MLFIQRNTHLNVEQHRRLLNILALEEELKIIIDLKEKIKSSDDLYKLYVKGNRCDKTNYMQNHYGL